MYVAMIEVAGFNPSMTDHEALVILGNAGVSCYVTRISRIKAEPELGIEATVNLYTPDRCYMICSKEG